MFILFTTMQVVVSTALLMIVLLQMGKKAKVGLTLDQFSHRTFWIRRRLSNGLNTATTAAAVIILIVNVLGFSCILQP